MSGEYRSAPCYCADEDDTESHIESNSDLEGASHTCKSITTVNSRFLLEPSLHERYSEKSLVAKFLRDIDADRMSRISLQNVRLSLVFPEASLQSFPSPSFLFQFQCKVNGWKFYSSRCSRGGELNQVNIYLLAPRLR